jgi:signal transduction histidine kinase
MVAFVAISLEPVERTVKLFAVALAAGSLVVVALVGLTTWWALGRALRPIEGINREVEAISAADLGRRVPAPGTFDEIDRLAATMNAMLERLDASAERQRRFTADASHELRSPLAAMRIQLEVALAHPDTADWVTTGLDVLADHGRVERLAQDLLVLARLDAGPAHLAFERVDLGDIADEEIGRRPPVPALTRVGSRIPPCGVLGDRAQLGRMVRNLLDNAERHARHRVEVTVAHEPDSVVLRVSDDGPGIAPADRDRIFERFTRLDAARANDDGGNGLGLAIVHEIAITHAARVVVADRPGGGACFEVRLAAAR